MGLLRRQIVYCARGEGDKWYCVKDEIYLRMYRDNPSVGESGYEIFKENGDEYFINKDGRYEKKDQHKG